MKKPFAFLFLLNSSAAISAQTDTLAPSLVCKTVYTTPPSDDCSAVVYASALIDTVFDNSNATITLGVRTICSGEGFPMTNSVNSYSFGNLVEVWAKDATGNTTSCLVSIHVYDPGNCDYAFSFITQTHDSQEIPYTNIKVEAGHCMNDSIHYQAITDGSGNYFHWGTIVPNIGYTATITPSRKINPLNGVTTYDLVLIQKHILGIESLGSPYKLIAADANLDGKVTTADIVLLRKMLLGIIQELPHGQSWRFVTDGYVFPNPANPFSPPFPDKYMIHPSDESFPGSFYFIGVKIGDVNDTANPGN